MRKPTPLKVAIVLSGRTQKDIAAEVELDEATFSRVVNGLHTSQANRANIARALGRSTEELFPPTIQIGRVA